MMMGGTTLYDETSEKSSSFVYLRLDMPVILGNGAMMPVEFSPITTTLLGLHRLDRWMGGTQNISSRGPDGIGGRVWPTHESQQKKDVSVNQFQVKAR
jgi:hypothetical protein